MPHTMRLADDPRGRRPDGGRPGATGIGPGLSLGVAALTLAVQNGALLAFGVLYLPLVREFGEGRGMVAAVQSAVLLLTGLGAPLVGAALDRWGPRRLFQVGAAVAAVGPTPSWRELPKAA